MINTIKTAIQKLEAGEIIAIPTETVYGLAVDSANEAAIEALYELKGRDPNKPFQMMVQSLEDAAEFVKLDDRSRKLSQAFLPGPLSLVLPSKGTPNATIAIRIPNHPTTLQLLKEWRKPITATSANLSGQPAATSAEEVKAIFHQLLRLDGGECSVGVASTVVDLTGKGIKILREGSITLEQLNSRL
jgi:tRNA threonylcarbamoyl adenosine modification protein (Sua5/YciO/YrdC/YwlC family)